jgi:hypothetical protein
MGTEKEYEKLLRHDARRVDKDVGSILTEFRGLLPLFDKAKFKKRYHRSKDTGLTFDYHEWRIERDKDFIVSHMRVVLKADRLAWVMADDYHPYFVVGAGSYEKPNWGSLLVGSRGDSEQQVIVDDLNMDHVKLALVQAARAGLVVQR